MLAVRGYEYLVNVLFNVTHLSEGRNVVALPDEEYPASSSCFGFVVRAAG